MMNKLVKPAVYDYSARRKVIDSLCAEYEFIKRSVIGRSCGGRDICAIKIGSAAEYSLIARLHFTAASPYNLGCIAYVY